MNHARQHYLWWALRCAVIGAVATAAPTGTLAAGGQLLNLPEPTGDRFSLTEKIWPSNPGDTHVCLWADDAHAAVSITIDDNNAPDHDWWVQTAATYEIDLTWFVITCLVETSSFHGTWADFLDLNSYGHDVQSHTVTHLNFDRGFDPNDPDHDVNAEYRDSQAKIELEIAASCLTLAYPGGTNSSYNDRTIADDYYIAARGTTGTLNAANKIDYMQTNSVSGGLIPVNPSAGWSQMVNLFDNTDGYRDWEYRGWYCCHWHGLSDTSKAQIITGLDYLAQQDAAVGVWIATFREVTLYGQERDTAEVTVTTVDPTQILFTVSDDMLDSVFTFPLTIKVRLYSSWTDVAATQNGEPIEATYVTHNGDPYALIQAVPDQGAVVLTPGGAPPTNLAPVVDAGADHAVTMPAAAPLDGTVSDDGLPNPPATVTAMWSKVSGPGAVTFADASAVDTSATFSVDGTYVLQLTADDSDLTAVDTVTITVSSSGDGATYNVTGDTADQEIWNGTSFRFVGGGGIRVGRSAGNDAVGVLVFQLPDIGTETVTDAHLQFNLTSSSWYAPAGQLNLYGLGYRSTSAVELNDFFLGAYGSDATDATAIQADFGLTWSGGQSSSVAGVYGADTAGDAALAGYIAAQYAAGAQAGDYVFCRLNPDTVQTGDYYWSIASADSGTPPTLSIVTGAGGPTNVAPTVDAGADDTITLPAGVSLDGTVSDDGLPNPPAALTTTWTKVSGPGTITFANAAAVDTTASFSADGVYVLQLEANDGELTASDSLTITVNPVANAAPAVDAGADAAVTLPTAAALDGTVGDDGLPNPPAAVTVTWTKVSGLGTVTFADANAVDTTATFSADGTYVLQLEVDDGALTASDAVTITVSPASGGTVHAVAGDAADQEIWNGTTLRWVGGGGMRVGRSAGNDAAVVLVFQLPADGTVTDAHLDFNFISSSWYSPVGQLNLYGLGFRSGSAVALTDYFLGAYGSDATDATAIQAEFGITWAGGQSASAAGVYGTDIAGDAALVSYLNAQYAAGAQAGDYVFLRLNPDTAQTSDTYWNIASADTATAPILTMTVSGP